MNEIIKFLSGSELLDQIGWALVHSLWQALMIGLILWIFLKITRYVLHSGLRYLASLLALLLVVALTIATILNGLLVHPGNTATGIYDYTVLLDPSGFGSKAPGLLVRINEFLGANMFVIIGIWIIGVLISFFRFFGGLSFVRKVRKESRLITGNVAEMAANMATRLHIPQKFRVVQSSLMQVPVLIGYVKPLIVFPEGMVSNLSIHEIQAILAHELAHIKRHDYLLNIIQSAIEAFYYFNPFVWWISSMIREEREQNCDEIAINYLGDRISYARTLIKLSELSISHREHFATGMIANGRRPLLKRVKLIMKEKMKRKPLDLASFAILIAILIVPAFIIAKGSNSSNSNGQDEKALTTLAPGFEMVDIRISQQLPSITDLNDTVPEEPQQSEITIDTGINSNFQMDFTFDPDLEMDLHTQIDPLPMQRFDLDFDFDIPPVPPFMFFDTDTLPERLREEEWEDFSKKLRKQMERLQEQMSEFDGQFWEKFRNDWQEWEETHLKEMERLHEKLNEQMADMHIEKFEEMQEMQERMQEQLNNQDWQFEIQENMKELQEKLKDLPDFEQEMKEMQKNLQNELQLMEEFQNELTGMLIEDGYIQEGDRIDVEYEEDDVLVNGEKIKQEDLRKYIDLRKRYFSKDEGRFRYRID